MNKHHQTETNTKKQNRVVVTREEDTCMTAKWVKRIKCMVVDGNVIFGGEYMLGAQKEKVRHT